jgi:CoA:oxalate CoA-transferase
VTKALSGLKVLDLTHMLSGPYGAMILADMGAETVKVEPIHGEATRKLLADDPAHSIDGMGAYFVTLNRNKKSVAIDLKSAEGLTLFYDLVKKADIVIDNYAAGVTEKLKIDYPRLSAINPAIISCSVTGFGLDGPDAKRPAFDQVVQAYGGGMSITGADPQQPMRSGIPHGDLAGGMFAVMGILAAVNQRHHTGIGQQVDISMLDCQISMLSYMATMHFLSGTNPTPIGNAHFIHVPYNTFTTSDGFVVIAIIVDSFWDNLVDLLDCDQLRKASYKSQPGRLAERILIEARINELLATNSSEYWLQKMQEKRIPCAPVNRFSEALSDPQILHRNMVVDLAHPNGAHTKGPGNPIKLSQAGADSFTPAPLLGQDTDTVLASWLGLDSTYVDQLRQRKVIA